MKILTRGYLYMVLSLILGALFPVVLVFAKGVDIFEFFMLSYLLAIPFALLLVIASKRWKTFTAYVTDPKRLGIITLIGLLTYASVGIGLFYAEQFVSASLATVVFRTSPLLMLLLLPTVLNERLTKSQIAALCLAFAGIYIALSGGQLFGIFGNANISIVLFLVAAAFAYALGAVLIRKYVFNLESAMLIFNMALFVIFAALYVATGVNSSQLQLSQLGAIFYVGIFTNICSFYMYFNSLRILKMTVATNFLFLSPFLTLLFASVLLGEVIQPYYVVIALLVGAGLIIQRYDRVGGSYRTRDSKRLRNFAIFDVTGAFVNTGELAIQHAIQKGGRVLALKLDAGQKQKVNSLISDGGHSGVFTDEHPRITEESTFVKEIVGAKENEFVVMKAGDTEEGERFFETLSDAMGV